VTYCLLAYTALVAINLLGATLAALDKKRARHASGRRRRIRESTFRLIALLGGTIGMLLAMQTLRHKTRHRILLASLTALGLVSLAGWVLLLHTLGCIPV
jgi:uncharacterized membrane protein YsdA (DUF1294 family)